MVTGSNAPKAHRSLRRPRLRQASAKSRRSALREGGSAGRGVAVGTAIARRPPHRSGRAVLPHPAPTLGHDAKPVKPVAVHAQARWARLPGSVSGARCARACSPWSAPFPPSSPPPLAGTCSMTSSVLRSGPTSQRRASSPCVRRLRDAALSCQGDTGISRFPDEVRPRVRGVFDRAGSASDLR